MDGGFNSVYAGSLVVTSISYHTLLTSSPASLLLHCWDLWCLVVGFACNLVSSTVPTRTIT
eukprot:992401-Amphidinium_carterae.1